MLAAPSSYKHVLRLWQQEINTVREISGRMMHVRAAP